MCVMSCMYSPSIRGMLARMFAPPFAPPHPPLLPGESLPSHDNSSTLDALSTEEPNLNATASEQSAGGGLVAGTLAWQLLIGIGTMVGTTCLLILLWRGRRILLCRGPKRGGGKGAARLTSTFYPRDSSREGGDSDGFRSVPLGSPSSGGFLDRLSSFLAGFGLASLTGSYFLYTELKSSNQKIMDILNK